MLVTHQPPVGLGDAGGVGHPGSCMLLRRLEALAAPPLLHVFGHIHAGHGVHAHATLDRRGRFNHRKLDRRRTPGDRATAGFFMRRTTFVNAAICDDDYRPVQKPVLVTLQGPAPAS